MFWENNSWVITSSQEKMSSEANLSLDENCVCFQ
jgi:hypothetical protein